MELLIFGHAGARALVFPTSMGKFYEWEDRGMTDALRWQLERGQLQLYCVDSVDAESWYNDWVHPGARAWRHIQYENYVLKEVLPLSQAKNSNPYLIVMGASFGAYHAVNIAFRHPHAFQRVLALSGVYDIARWTDGHYDDNIFYNNPAHFIQHEHDPWRLAHFRRMDIILTTSHDDPSRDNTQFLSRQLWGKGIGNALRVWDGWAHDWPWWRKMAQMYVGGHD